MKQGAVAAGHPETARAAAMVLENGGNAFDAALAAFLASCVAEPVLSSLGGGGFLLARPAGRPPKVLDFFVQTPRRKLRESACDFRPVTADFGTTTQQFHAGFAAMAVPGAVRGVFDAHAALGRMPLKELAEPARMLARDGLTVNPQQAYVFSVVKAILALSADSRALFFRRSDDGTVSDTPLQAGDTFRHPLLADVLDALTHEGPDLFYRGEIARALTDAHAEHGGHLTAEDLRTYRTHIRDPLSVKHDDITIHTNPPPSSGGTLIAFGLEMLRGQALHKLAWGSRAQRRLLARVMDLTGAARATLEVQHGDEWRDRLLDPALLETWRSQIEGRASAYRGTTHISVVDAAGNAAALTVSNGEGSGWMIPGTGIIMNNMLGEEDLLPGGGGPGGPDWLSWPTDSRMTSMMAPTLAIHRDGGEWVLGSGGSRRIRSALLQVLANLFTYGMPLDDAITAPRLHCENGRLSLECDLPDGLAEEWRDPVLWPERNMYFGGVHAVQRTRSGGLDAFADPRRDGAALIV
ncbi:gamma-glutamyltransferase family protein [Novispirillum itersonii]|uniref:Gamma-glutamyltranspeptidase/glutathione hydrolase n=1 Tax=Novispirillum itersonii TaxID=189 RepID=A0A7W9ZGW7_NOVIT|nr:gamma-glutamyltransferase [Novispirillum itersonii]MBB6211025.1 gamma-glutamyltranspeptidase/glutathione hydrolase [Novispirillum itersonii]